MTRKVSIFNRLLLMVAAVTLFVVNALAQGEGLQREREEINQSGSGMWLTMGFLALAGLAAAGYFWWRSKKGANKVEYNYKNRYANYYNEQASEDDTVDADKELEWLRKARGESSRAKNEAGKKRDKKIGFSAKSAGSVDSDLAQETRIFQEKMRKMQYAQLPINSFSQLAPAKRYTPLPDSDDPALISAIEQASDEYEEDEAVREIALKVLAAFRNHNAVEALSEMALYDLSSNLRSKAVAFLAEYDHESVFESILLACADPTREVRAAAARGLFTLGFDRAHAWKRLIEANDTFRLTQAARAAIASDIVSRSFERLIHEDTKVAYEAFALVALLIKAGETKEMFEAIESHKDERVKFALLHVLKVQKDERTMEELTRLALALKQKPEMLEKVKDTMTAIQASVQQEALQSS